jgi:predicted nucleic acid-binding Zn ribbon protein
MIKVNHPNKCDICGKMISINQFRCSECCKKYRDVYREY